MAFIDVFVESNASIVSSVMQRLVLWSKKRIPQGSHQMPIQSAHTLHLETEIITALTVAWGPPKLMSTSMSSPDLKWRPSERLFSRKLFWFVVSLNGQKWALLESWSLCRNECTDFDDREWTSGLWAPNSRPIESYSNLCSNEQIIEMCSTLESGGGEQCVKCIIQYWSYNSFKFMRDSLPSLRFSSFTSCANHLKSSK